MSRLRVEAVVPARHPATGEVGVDRPASGFATDHLGLLLQGWFANPSKALTGVRARVNGRDLRAWPVHDDGTRTRYHAVLGALDLPARFKIELVPLGDGLSAAPALTITGRRAVALREAEPGEPAPLLVAAQGRAGSTMLMRLLAGHPDIVARTEYPCETRLAQYEAHLARLQLTPADLLDPALERMEGADGPGPNPYFRPDPETVGWMAGAGARAALESAVRRACSFYRHVARVAGRSEKFGFFAEKTPPRLQRIDLMRAVFPRTRPVLLIRDPRDVLASILAFDAKRGFRAFGRENTRDDADFARRFARQTADLAQFRAQVPDAAVVHYEDLVRRPEASLTALWRTLGVAADRESVRAALRAAEVDPDGSFAEHRTARDAAASVGRWRRDLPAAVREVCAGEMAASLADLGYADGEETS